jgi:hypothetical protein
MSIPIWLQRYGETAPHQVYLSEDSVSRIQQAMPQPRPQVVREVIHERPRVNLSEAALAAIAVMLVGGLLYALCKSSFGRFVLIAGATVLAWNVLTSPQMHEAMTSTVQVQTTPAPVVEPSATPVVQAQLGYAPRAQLVRLPHPAQAKTDPLVKILARARARD